MASVLLNIPSGAGVSCGQSDKWLLFTGKPVTARDWLAQAEAVLRHYLLLSPNDCDLDEAVADRNFEMQQDPFEYAEWLSDKFGLDVSVPFPPTRWRFAPPASGLCA